MILSVLISILVLSGIAFLLNKFLRFKICPICAGVFLTWLGLLILKFLNYSFDFLILALLMGGSVVGIVYKLGENIKSDKNLFLWKLIAIPLGFLGFYNLIYFRLLWFILAAFFVVILFFILKNNYNNQKVEEIEKKLKNCC